MPDDPAPPADGTAPEFYISASGSPLEARTRTLKHDDSFAIFDAYGVSRLWA